MTRYLLSIFIVCAIAVSSAQAETYIRDYTYSATELDTRLTSRAISLHQLKASLLQQIAAHFREKIDITKDGAGKAYASEDVNALSSGLTKVDIVNEKWNGGSYYLKAKLEADTERVLNVVKEFKNKKTRENLQLLKMLKANQRILKKSQDTIVQLTQDLKGVKNRAQKEQLLNKYVREIDQLSAALLFDRGFNDYQRGLFKVAVDWYRKSANKGYALAQFKMGYISEVGRGVRQDNRQALRWYRKACEGGNKDACAASRKSMPIINKGRNYPGHAPR